MKIEKLETHTNSYSVNFSMCKSKINELIDAFNSINYKICIMDMKICELEECKYKKEEKECICQGKIPCADCNPSLLRAGQKGSATPLVFKKEEKELEIFPCPWCGSKRIQFIDFGFNNESYRGECLTCQAHNSPRKTKEEAIDAWNKRA